MLGDHVQYDARTSTFDSGPWLEAVVHRFGFVVWLGLRRALVHGFFQVHRNVSIEFDDVCDVVVELSDECHVLAQPVWISRIVVGVDATDEFPARGIVSSSASPPHASRIVRLARGRTCYVPGSSALVRSMRIRSMLRSTSPCARADVANTSHSHVMGGNGAPMMCCIRCKPCNECIHGNKVHHTCTPKCMETCSMKFFDKGTRKCMQLSWEVCIAATLDRTKRGRHHNRLRRTSLMKWGNIHSKKKGGGTLLRYLVA